MNYNITYITNSFLKVKLNLCEALIWCLAHDKSTVNTIDYYQ